MTSQRRVREWMQHLTDIRGGSDTPQLDAQLLLMFVTDKTRAWLMAYGDADLAINEKETLEKFAAGMPMAYLLGEQEFWSLPLQVNPATLIPRPETEGLVEWVLQNLSNKLIRLLDLGTGSGAIALALKSERPNWQVTATDQSQDALVVAAANAKKLQLDVEFIAGSWWQAVPGHSFDCIVSNPPYIAQGDPHMNDLGYEPASALTAGAGGLDDLSTIAQGVYDHLNEGGWLVVEHGYDQQQVVKELLVTAGLSSIQGYQDLSGQDRFLVGQKEKA